MLEPLFVAGEPCEEAGTKKRIEALKAIFAYVMQKKNCKHLKLIKLQVFAPFFSFRPEVLKAASHRIRLRLTIRLMVNGSLPTCTKNTITDNTVNPVYLKQF